MDPILGRVFNRSRTYRLVIILLFAIISLIVIFGAYGAHADVGTIWTYTSRIHQSFVNTTTQPWQLKRPIFNFASQETNASTSDFVYKHSNSEPPEKTDDEYPADFSMLDGIKVSPPAPPADNDNYLAICLLVKEVPKELREFLTHHYYHHGIRRFYLYDDGSNPPLSSHPIQSTYNVPPSVLNFTYIEPESFTLADRKRIQQRTMERCIKEHGQQHHWLGLLDPDEFLEMRHPLHPTLLGWLRHWEEKGSMFVRGGGDEDKSQSLNKGNGRTLKVGGLGISWLPHNSANLVEIPASGGFRKNYNECVAGAPVANKSRGDFWQISHTKSFVRPQAVDYIQNIHLPVFKDGWDRFSEHGDFEFTASLTPPTTEYWALHHYATGSRRYFELKQSKGRSQGPGMWPVDEVYWDRYHNQVTTYTCDEMTKYNP